MSFPVPRNHRPAHASRSPKITLERFRFVSCVSCNFVWRNLREKGPPAWAGASRIPQIARTPVIANSYCPISAFEVFLPGFNGWSKQADFLSSLRRAVLKTSLDFSHFEWPWIECFWFRSPVVTPSEIWKASDMMPVLPRPRVDFPCPIDHQIHHSRATRKPRI
jgi:hypothetical protein